MGVKLAGYLEKRRAGYSAVVDVPPSQRKAVGCKRLRKGLGTRDVHIANSRELRALIELHGRIAAALREDPATDPMLKEALELRRSVGDVRVGKLTGWGLPPQFVEERGEMVEVDPKFLAEGLLSDTVERRAEEIEREQGPKRAQAFAAVALGSATPMTLHVEDWLAEPGQKGARRGRTTLDYLGIVTTFAAWAAEEGAGTVEALTRRLAGRYLSKLHSYGLSAARIRTVVSALSTYWAWMSRRGMVEVDDDRNPWRGQSPQKAVKVPQERERDFTDVEVVKLLTKAPDPVMRDLMLIAALTGARIEEICRLTVGMCQGGVFDLPGSKTAAAPRKVPIHPELGAMVAERCRGKPAAAYLLLELGGPNRFGERSGAIGKRFGRFRQEAGVHDREEDRRRSKVNFHSFRRYFITKALQAGQPARLVQQVVGHKLPGMTEGVYFGGDTLEALRACVESVQLPEAARAAATEPPSATPRPSTP